LRVLTAGFLVADVIAADLPKVSDPGELTFAPRGIRLTLGGHPANVSIDLLQLGLRRGDVGLVGAVGRDMFGEFVRRTLTQKGVIAHLKEVPKAGTTSDMILVAKGEDRRYHVDLGASWHFDPKELLKVLRRERPDLLYVATGICGMLDDRLDHVLADGKRLGCTTFVDLVSPYGKGWDFIHKALRHTDVLHCNDFEAKSITGVENLSGALNGLVRMGVDHVFVTLGKGGATLLDSHGTLIEQPSFDVKVVDPTGAGDAFCAGLIYQLLKGNLLVRLPRGLDVKTLRRLLMVAQATGAICTTDVGTTTAVTRKNLDRLVKDQGGRIEAATVVRGSRGG